MNRRSILAAPGSLPALVLPAWAVPARESKPIAVVTELIVDGADRPTEVYLRAMRTAQAVRQRLVDAAKRDLRARGEA